MSSVWKYMPREKYRSHNKPNYKAFKRLQTLLYMDMRRQLVAVNEKKPKHRHRAVRNQIIKHAHTMSVRNNNKTEGTE